jgi:hypothetical protein
MGITRYPLSDGEEMTKATTAWPESSHERTP